MSRRARRPRLHARPAPDALGVRGWLVAGGRPRVPSYASEPAPAARAWWVSHDWIGALGRPLCRDCRARRACPGWGDRIERPDGLSSEVRDALEVLGLTAPPDAAGLERAWRAAVARAHPDAGGTHAHAARVNAARDCLRAVL